MKKYLLASLLGTMLATTAQAVPFGKTGQWIAGGSHGYSEYFAKQSDKTYWIITCNWSEYEDPRFSLVVDGKEVKTYDIVVDGMVYPKPYWKPFARNDGNMYNMWWALRKGKDIKAKVGNRYVQLPSKGSAKALPSELDTTNYCIPNYNN